MSTFNSLLFCLKNLRRKTYTDNRFFSIDNYNPQNIVVFATVFFTTFHPRNGGSMFREKISIFPQFIKKVFYDHDISKLNLDINTTQVQILMLVSENSDKSMSGISRMTGLEKSSFTRSVDCLVNNGFITKKPSENDRRVIQLSLTARGSRAAKLIKSDFAAYLDSLIADFTETEKMEFFSSLSTVTNYMNRILEANRK